MTNFNETWIDECDLNPMIGDFFERIGPLGPNSITIHRILSNKIGSQIIKFDYYLKQNHMGISSLDLREDVGGRMMFKVISRDYDYRFNWMRTPCQYRKITDQQEILKYEPMPKFDWSYC